MKLKFEELCSTDSRILDEIKRHLKKNTNDLISFSGQHESYCVGIVDIVNSTKVSANLSNSEIISYYSIFLNIMSIIAKKFNAKIVKNIGDCLLFYFPKTSDGCKYKILNSVNCAFTMINCKSIINEKMHDVGLPKLCYRLSLDYGTLLLAQSGISSCEYIFGSTVNICAKINHFAEPYGMVIGHDLFQIIQDYPFYNFESISSFSVRAKFDYDIHSVKQKIL